MLTNYEEFLLRESDYPMATLGGRVADEQSTRRCAVLARRVAVIFQYVVPFLDVYLYRRRRGGAKVEIGCNDFQGADLPRRLLHGLGCATVQNVRSRWEQRLDHLQVAQPARVKHNLYVGCPIPASVAGVGIFVWLADIGRLTTALRPSVPFKPQSYQRNPRQSAVAFGFKTRDPKLETGTRSPGPAFQTSVLPA